MPYIHASIGKNISPEQRRQLGEALGKAVTVIPDKTYERTMVHLEDGCAFFRGGQPAECAFLDVRLRGENDFACQQEFAAQVYDIFEQILDIPQSQLYINVLELTHWGSNGALK